MRAAGLLLSLVLAASASTPVPQAQWRRLDSPNFVVIGEVGAGELRDIAVKFEAFREVLGLVLNQRVTATPVPTVVLVFRGDATFRPFMPTYQGKRVEVAGLFVPRQDVNHIAMVSDGNDERLRVIFHEYAHLLINNTGQRVPVWLSEGIAEYYSTFELQRGGREAIIGRAIGPHLGLLNSTTLLKLPELLGVDHQSPLYNEGTRRSVFYSQAWALTHMLLRSEKDRGPQIAAYLAELTNGQPPMDAWQRAFGGEDLARDLQNYIRRQAFTATIYKFTGKLATFDAQAAPIPPADLDAYLADFLVQENSLDEATARLAAVEKREPGNARAKVARASLASDKGDFDTAERILRSVGDVDDWFLNYRAGVEFVSAMQGRRATVIPADVALARKHFDRARSGGQEFANSLARLASLEVASFAGPTSETRASLERARSIAPGRHDYGLLLAHVLARLRDFEAARALLGPLMNTNNPEPIREAARSLMGTVVTIEAEYARRAATPPAASAPGGSRPAGNSSGSPIGLDRDDPAIRPFYRELKPGEQRLEGSLESIECVVGRGVTFRVKTRTESVGVTSPDLTSVDFITYRSDLKGSVQCGPIAPPLGVYVTWRPGSAAGTKVAVAIEFLPVK